MTGACSLTYDFDIAWGIVWLNIKAECRANTIFTFPLKGVVGQRW